MGPIEGSDDATGSDIGFTAMDLSRDGRSLVVATGYKDPQIRVLDATNGQLIRKLKGHMSWVCELAFSPDGRELASASADHTITGGAPPHGRKRRTRCAATARRFTR
jgi:WD40 repeat protein